MESDGHGEARGVELAIVGYRFYNDYPNFKKEVDLYIDELGENIKIQNIVSGGAQGVDKMVERYALEHGYKTLIFKPDWKKIGRGAGILRNTNIVEVSTHVLAFRSDKSVGTKDTIRKAEKMGRELKIISI